MPATSLRPCNFGWADTPIRWAGSAAILVTLMAVLTAGLNAQTFVPINFPGGIATQARGINAFGQIVGNWTDSGNQTHAFLYDAGTYTSFDYPGTMQGTSAYGINNAG